MDYSYLTIDEVRTDLGETGADATWLDFVKTGTQLTEVAFWGNMFVPLTETRSFDGPGGIGLDTPNLLSSAPTVINDGLTLAAGDIVLYPRYRRWLDGPYSRIEVEPDATGLTAWTTERNNITVAGKWGWYDKTAIITGATVQDAVNQAAGSTTLTVQTGKIKVGHLLLIGTELEFVTAVTIGATDTCTVVRGVLGTTDAAHANGTQINRQAVPDGVHWTAKSITASLWKRAKSGFTGRTVVPELGQINLFDVMPKEVVKELSRQYRPEVIV